MRIDNLLHRLYMARFKAYDETKCPHPVWGYYALEWYIGTNRASLNFVSACEKLSDRRMVTLIQKASAGSVDDGITAAKRYLKIA